MGDMRLAISEIPSDIRSFGKSLAQFVLLMLFLQAVRAGMTLLLWYWQKPGDIESLWNKIHLVSFAVMLPGFWLLVRPSLQEIGARMGGITPRERSLYRDAGVVLVALVFALRLRAPELMLRNVVFVLMVPVYEEVLFRGYGWDKINRALGARPQWLTLLAVTLSFGLWHLGYVDVLLLRALPYSFAGPSLGAAIAIKVLTALLLGLVTGLVRWRTGHIFGPILIHGFWNLFSY